MGLLIGASVISIVEFVYFMFFPTFVKKTFNGNEDKCVKVLATFAKFSSIHGMNHASNQGKTFAER